MSIKRDAALVADDHVLFRAGLSVLLKRDCAFHEVIETSTLDEAAQMLGERPDVTFASFDLSLPGLASALDLQSLREAFPTLCLVVVTGSRRREDILYALTAGVHGYVPKALSPDAIVAALERVLVGEIFVPAAVAELPPSAALPGPESLRDGNARLTLRQLEVLQCIRDGKSNKEIARILSLSESTVKVHTHAIYRTLGVHNRASAAVAPARA